MRFPPSAILLVIAAFYAFVIAILTLAAPLVSPYYKVYGAKGDYRGPLFVLAFAVAAKLIGF